MENLQEYKFKLQGYTQCLLDLIDLLEKANILNYLNIIRTKKDFILLLKEILKNREKFIHDKEFIILTNKKEGKKTRNFCGIKYVE